MDHDQRFKALLRELFPQFIDLFFPAWANRYDVKHPEWLDKELFPDPPEGGRHLVNLAGKVRRIDDDTDACILLHVEIESSDTTTSIRERLPAYHAALRNAYGYPVLPIVVFLKVGLDGIGIDTCEEWIDDFRVFQLNFFYIGLPGLDAVRYIQGGNVLGVALSSLMRFPPGREAELYNEALCFLANAPVTEQQRYLLVDVSRLISRSTPQVVWNSTG